MKTHLEKKSLLFLRSIQNIIDLDPAFQREKVWSAEKKELFIDSLLNEWGVPKVYLAAYKNTHNKVYKYECIDGKQRLSTIFDFLNGAFVLNTLYKGQTYDSLDLEDRERLGKYELDIEIVEDFEGSELAELFQRLQAGVVLNTSEKLKSTPGDMTEFIFKLTQSKFFTEKFKSKVKRNPHVATITQAALLATKNNIVNLKYKDLLAFLKNYSKFNKNSEEAKKIKNILRYIDAEFTVEDAHRVFTNRAIFVSCFYLISYLMLRGDISRLKIKDFFVSFSKQLSGSKKGSDSFIKDFKLALVQSADSATSIKARHEILLAQFIKFDKRVASLVNYKTLDEEFRLIYKTKLSLFNGEHKKLNQELLRQGVSQVNLNNGYVESIPVYIRHSNEHPSKNRTYKYTDKDLKYAIKILKQL